MPLSTSDFASNAQEQLLRVAEHIGSPGSQRRLVAAAVYYHKSKRRTVEEVCARTGLNRIQVLKVGSVLDGIVFDQTEVGGKIAYAKRREYQKHWKQIIGLADSRAMREALPTKRVRAKSIADEIRLTPSRCTIVFFAAHPPSTGTLDLGEEARAISTKLRAAKFRDTISLVQAWAARPDDLLQYLNEHDATVVHFSGHGTGMPGLVMQDETGQPKLVDGNALRALFKAVKGNVRLVVLNACRSTAQAMAIAKEIDCVIGMRVPVGDEAARIFAAALYRAIGFGKSIQEAFDQGRAAVMLEGIPEQNAPILICRKGISASAIALTSLGGTVHKTH